MNVILKIYIGTELLMHIGLLSIMRTTRAKAIYCLILTSYYKNGYPGKSSEVAVLSGVKSLIDKEFVDKDRIGVQGHSWGGYQVAHLLTKTDMFKCAESGAPVVNMISAYGGIRWGSGMSRQFQYEKTQSRLGATLWENP